MGEVNMESVQVELKLLFENFTKIIKPATSSEENNVVQNSGDSRENWESNYENILHKLDASLGASTEDSDDFLRLLSMKASIMYENAKVLWTNNKLESSQEMLLTALNITEPYFRKPQITFLYLRILNHLSYLLSSNSDSGKAKELLEKVANEEIDTIPILYNTEELFNAIPCDQTYAFNKMKKLLINNMQMLAWIYGQTADYIPLLDTQHKILKMQIEIGDGEPFAWAIRCMKMASQFLAQYKWVKARYHLSVARTLLNRLEMQNVTNAELFKAQADLGRTIIYYALQLFYISKKSILETPGYVYRSVYVDSPEVDEQDTEDNFYIRNLDVQFITIAATLIRTNLQARNLFKEAFKTFKRVQLYYSLRDFPLEYVNTVLDISELYKSLVFYESDSDAQYEVQRKRYESLEALSTVLKEARPNCYIAASVEILRELSETQIEMMHINLRRLFTVENELTENTMQYKISALTGLNRGISKVSHMINNDFKQYQSQEQLNSTTTIESTTEDEEKVDTSETLMETTEFAADIKKSESEILPNELEAEIDTSEPEVEIKLEEITKTETVIKETEVKETINLLEVKET